MDPHVLVARLTHPAWSLPAHSCCALAEQALRMHLPWHLPFLPWKQGPTVFLQLRAAVLSHLQTLRASLLKVISLATNARMACCLHFLASGPFPHCFLASLLACLLILLVEEVCLVTLLLPRWILLHLLAVLLTHLLTPEVLEAHSDLARVLQALLRHLLLHLLTLLLKHLPVVLLLHLAVALLLHLQALRASFLN
jgi:hypothetical protein